MLTDGQFCAINKDLFIESDIRWPSDRTITTCDNLAPTASELSRLIPSGLQCGQCDIL